MPSIAPTPTTLAHRKCSTLSTYLAARGTIKWPFAQFRKPLITQDRELDVDKEGRRQILNASLNGIKRSVAFREE
jgi:hypothetical protein